MTGILEIGPDANGHWSIDWYKCPGCSRFSFVLGVGEAMYALPHSGGQRFAGFKPGSEKKWMVWPHGSSRPPCPVEVPKDIGEDYTEACIVLSHSEKASAALSRRCLQHVLHHQGFKDKNLDTEIQNAIKSGKLPSHVSEALDAIRVTGNFAAHPMKSTASGEIVPVESHEAEWNLETLEQLFDCFYVQPAMAKKKRDELNKKLAAAGKPPLK